MAPNDDANSGPSSDRGVEGVGWFAVTLDGRLLCPELAGAISLLLRSAEHGFISCNGQERVPAETAAAMLGVSVEIVESRAAAGLLPSTQEGEGKLFGLRDIVEHRARMGEREAAMRVLYDEFDDGEPDPEPR